MLVRDAEQSSAGELEVFMLRRNLRSGFIGGAHVFPGGALDPEDRTPAMLARCAGLDDAGACKFVGRGPGALGFWVAAIRETFEEAGVLLARSAATDTPVDVSAPGLAERLAAARRAVATGERTLLDVVLEHDLVLDCGALAVIARFITPKGAARRYDTWFFVAAAPHGHAYLHDDDETIGSEWLLPSDALDRARRKELDILYPTFRALQLLTYFRSASELLGAVHRVWQADPDPLQRVPGRAGWTLRLPGIHGANDEADARRHGTRSGPRPRVQEGSACPT